MGRVFCTGQARVQLDAIYDYISEEASLETAERYTSAITETCDMLGLFPGAGVARDDLRPGLRTFSFRRRVTIAYLINADQVTVLGVFYGGQDFEAIVRDE